MALSPDTISEYFDKTSKCKISGELIKATKIGKYDGCTQNLELILKNENGYFKAIGIFNNGECILDTFYEQFFENDAKIGKNYNFILDNDFKILINLGNKQNFTTCTGNEINYKNNIYLNNYLTVGIIFILIFIIGIIIFKIKTKKQS